MCNKGQEEDLYTRPNSILGIKELEEVAVLKAVKYGGAHLQASARRKILRDAAKSEPVTAAGVVFNARGACSRSTAKLVRKLFPRNYGNFMALRILVSTAQMVQVLRRCIHLNRG